MIYYLLIIVIDLNDHGILQTDHENQLEHQPEAAAQIHVLGS